MCQEKQKENNTQKRDTREKMQEHRQAQRCCNNREGCVDWSICRLVVVLRYNSGKEHLD